MPVYEVRDDSAYENMLVDMCEIIFNDGDLYMNSREKVENYLRRKQCKGSYTSDIANTTYRRMLNMNNDYLIKLFHNKVMVRNYGDLLPKKLSKEIINRLCEYLVIEFESLNY